MGPGHLPIHLLAAIAAQKQDSMRRLLGFPGDHTRATPDAVLDALSARSGADQLTLVLQPQALSVRKGGFGAGEMFLRFVSGDGDGDLFGETPRFLPTRAEPALAAARICVSTPRVSGAGAVNLRIELWGAGRKRARLAVGSLEADRAPSRPGEPTQVEVDIVRVSCPALHPPAASQPTSSPR